MRPLAAILPFIAIVLSGCSSDAQSREIVIGLDQSLSQSATLPTIMVDAIGLTEAERREWDAMPLSAYWMPGSGARTAVKGRTVSARFGPERTEPVRVSIDNEVWTAWRKAGARWLYVVANLPGGVADRPGADDPRRLAVSLMNPEWAADAPFTIEVRRDAVVFTTPALPVAPARTSR